MLFSSLWKKNRQKLFSEQINFTLPFIMYHLLYIWKIAWVEQFFLTKNLLQNVDPRENSGWHAVKSIRRFTAYVFTVLFTINLYWKSLKHRQQLRKMKKCGLFIYLENCKIATRSAREFYNPRSISVFERKSVSTSVVNIVWWISKNI